MSNMSGSINTTSWSLSRTLASAPSAFFLLFFFFFVYDQTKTATGSETEHNETLWTRTVYYIRLPGGGTGAHVRRRPAFRHDFYITADCRNICTANLPSCTHSPLTRRGMLVPRVMHACPSVCDRLFSLLITGGENGGSICCSIRVSVSDVPLPRSRYPQGTEECCLTQGGEGGER